MSLKTYRQKRRFAVTPEPRGAAGKKKHAALRYVIQKHDASRLHYDFRLELDGTLKSWAVPKGPSLDPGRKSLAVQVEDHPIEYAEFEGVIPKGEYGGGTVLLWDRGTWEPIGDAREGLAHGKLHFILHGEKLQGEWALVQMHGDAGANGKNWLLFKIDDEFADKTGDILTAEPKSVKSKRGIEKIAGDRDAVWRSKRAQAAEPPAARASAFPAKLSPQLAVLAERPPHGDQWLHEIKFDGYRLLAFVKAGEVNLYTRHGLDWTAKFPGIARAMAKLKVDSAVVDGEAVVLDEKGRSDFQALQMTFKSKTGNAPVYYAFDLPFCDGRDLREVPLIERKEMLEKLLKKSRLEPWVRYSEHVRGKGDEMLANACTLDLEGVISKRSDAPYVSRREPSWIKSKCGARQEFVIIGYTDPKGSRSGFGSLLLGYHANGKGLAYAGRVGTGFDEARLKEMIDKLRPLERKDWPTDSAPPVRERRAAHWVEPKLVAEVRFTNWTRDGSLRHPVFIALRTDKPASQIVRERPVKPRQIEAISTPEKKGQRAVSKKTPTEIADVKLTHPDKILFADAKITKQNLADYYQSVSQWMLPHVADRPLAIVRCPEGLSGQCFFQRNWSENLPAAVDKVAVGDGKKKERHITIHDLAGLISLVQIGALEIHTWNCGDDDIEHPNQLIFDLDPGPDVAWKKTVEGARSLRRQLDSLKLPTFLKTSGGKGLHLTIPIKPNVDWDSAKSFCKTIAEAMVRQSDLFVANMRKDLRGGKIYIDYNRNGHFATAVAPYSTRRREGAPVSMPITWEELAKVQSAGQFTLTNVSKYLSRRRKDPWADFEDSRVDLRKIVEKVSVD